MNKFKHHQVMLDLHSQENWARFNLDQHRVQTKIRSTGFELREPTGEYSCLLASIDGGEHQLLSLVEINLQDGQAHFKHWNLHPLREDWCLTHQTNPAVQDIADAIVKAIYATRSTLQSLVRLMETTA